jgi:hypothetical protein
MCHQNSRGTTFMKYDSRENRSLLLYLNQESRTHGVNSNRRFCEYDTRVPASSCGVSRWRVYLGTNDIFKACESVPWESILRRSIRNVMERQTKSCRFVERQGKINWPNPSSRTMVLEPTQPLRKRYKGRPTRKAELTAIYEPIV